MRAIKLLLGLAMFSIVTGALAKVTVDYDETIDFGNYRTYAWKNGTPASSPQVQSYIEQAINDALQSGRLSQSTGAPDLYAVVHASMKREQEKGEGWFGYSAATKKWGMQHDTIKFEVGTLLVDLVEAKSKELGWRGLATKTLSKKPDNPESLNAKAIKKMFKRFPPK